MNLLPEISRSHIPQCAESSLHRSTAVRGESPVTAVGDLLRQYTRDLAQVRDGECFFTEIGRIQRERIHG
jgi:hypothetical protein